MKVALLSNVNMNLTIRMLSKELTVFETQGYGNELGVLLNSESTYYDFQPDVTFFIEDLMELLNHRLDLSYAKEQINLWFQNFEQNIREASIYYVSDAYLWGVELSVVADSGRKIALEQIWQQRLEICIALHHNVRIFAYRHLIESIGEEKSFSMKMWYMGYILHSTEIQKRLCEELITKVRLESKQPKKVLLLDLDNTLWGGLAGEVDSSPILLSEEHMGLAYKNLQRVILQMQTQGVLLGIVSKNNEDDAVKILKTHPHMLLRPEHFVIRKINWNAKHENIIEIAHELNLGLDSVVFFDDNPTERQLIKDLLPDVIVADFPEHTEELAVSMISIYRQYFEKNVLTREDMEKTEQYVSNIKREEIKKTVGNFDDYLKNLVICMTRVNPQIHVERMTQLINKTNQFNLTTKRLNQAQIQQLLVSDSKRIYLYQVTDCFGDNGIVATVIVRLDDLVPTIEEFTMSCRVMGKKIEYAIIDDVEQDLLNSGFDKLRGIYIPTQKNIPVARLWEELGYQKVMKLDDGGIVFEIVLSKVPLRTYYVTKIIEE